VVVVARPRKVDWQHLALAVFAAAALVPAFAAVLNIDPRVPTSYPAAYPIARLVDLAAGLGLVAAGLAGLAVRGSTTGPIAILLGVQWLAADVAGWQSGPIPVRSAAMLFLPLAVPLLAHLVTVLRDGPSERPARRRPFAMIAVVYALTSILHALVWTPNLDPACWIQCAGNSLLLAPVPGLARGLEVLWMAGSLIGGLVIAWVAVAAIAGERTGSQDRAAPLLALTAVAALGLAGHGLVGLLRPPEVPEELLFAGSYLVRGLAWSGIAIGVAWATWAAWRRARALARLGTELAENPDPGSFQSALRRSIGDPGIEVAYWQPTYGRYVDVEGREVHPAQHDRAVSTITRRGTPIAMVFHDPALSGTRALEDQIGAAAKVALDNERLRAEILAQVDDLRRARVRIVETGDAARRRLERDLHDGVQQRLLAAAYELQLAQAPTGPSASNGIAVLSDALDSTRDALREIRALAQGIHPLILTEGGLAAALDTFAEETPIPLELTVDRTERYAEHVETTAYAVVTEAVGDAVARGASYCAVVARRIDGRVRLRMEDDGAPRATAPVALADRVGALGGTIAQESGRLSVELPCE
jgi:signal transduction histidine kinase